LWSNHVAKREGHGHQIYKIPAESSRMSMNSVFSQSEYIHTPEQNFLHNHEDYIE
jgi:hypothetical protein